MPRLKTMTTAAISDLLDDADVTSDEVVGHALCRTCSVVFYLGNSNLDHFKRFSRN